MKLSVLIPVYNMENLILRAIKSIPPLKDIEIIVIDDCSTDDTLEIVRLYQQYSPQNIVVLHNAENRGVGYSVNKGLDFARGEYVVLLGSDDYFIDLFVLDELDGTDMIYFDLVTNDGSVFHLSQESKFWFSGSVKFIKRSFIGETRVPDMRQGEDWYFYNALMKKKPTEKFLNRVLKHYNYPREGSLSWKATHEDNDNNASL